jgi:hypothetical protein
MILIWSILNTLCSSVTTHFEIYFCLVTNWMIGAVVNKIIWCLVNTRKGICLGIALAIDCLLNPSWQLISPLTTTFLRKISFTVRLLPKTLSTPTNWSTDGNIINHRLIETISNRKTWSRQTSRLLKACYTLLLNSRISGDQTHSIRLPRKGRI